MPIKTVKQITLEYAMRVFSKTIVAAHCDLLVGDAHGFTEVRLVEFHAAIGIVMLNEAKVGSLEPYISDALSTLEAHGIYVE